VAALHEQITEGVAALVESEAWKAMLDAAARFHRYSLNNLLLIGMQAPTATRVAGFSTWRSLGRQVRKGERGIAILAPCTYRTTKAADGEAAGDTAAVTAGEKDSAGEGRPGRQVRGFRRAYVFDVAQTDGEPLAEVAPMLLSGEAPAGLWDALERQVEVRGYTVERGPCGMANGWTDPTSNTVRVRADVDDAQAVKTLAHELAHIECGHVTDLPTYAMCRGRCEIEAESVAYILSADAGLPTDGYSFAYIASWAEGDPALVRQAAETVTKAARTILTALHETTAAADGAPAGQDEQEAAAA